MRRRSVVMPSSVTRAVTVSRDCHSAMGRWQSSSASAAPEAVSAITTAIGRNVFMVSSFILDGLRMLCQRDRSLSPERKLLQVAVRYAVALAHRGKVQIGRA